MVQIKEELCTGCGICIKDCPGNAIKLSGDRAEAYRDCIRCGHCVAVCPFGAPEIIGYDMADVEDYNREAFTIPPENFLHAVKFRRSIRQF